MTTPSGSIRANLVDIAARRVFAAEIGWSAGVIGRIDELGAANPAWPCLIPGFIDAHVHIESSLLPPAEFARLAVRHGTVASVSDPHEIANVLGIDGVRWMLAMPGKRPSMCCSARRVASRRQLSRQPAPAWALPTSKRCSRRRASATCRK